MTFKKNTDRMTITHVEQVNLDDLYVSKILEGKKRPSRVPMSVKDFIEHISSFGLDGTIENEYDYDTGRNYLVVKTVREESDDEYETRMALLRTLDERQKEVRKKRTKEKQELEIELLKKLMEKYKGKI